jgi:hypothetical protein
MALDSKPRSQKWRNHALGTACRAVIDYEAILRQIPAEEKTLTPPPLVFRARIHPVKRSLIMLRPRKSRKARNNCGTADIIVSSTRHVRPAKSTTIRSNKNQSTHFRLKKK